MSEACSLIGEHHRKRMFPEYFFVKFFGGCFGELNQEEFIYKESPVTKLSEITLRLQVKPQ